MCQPTQFWMISAVAKKLTRRDVHKQVDEFLEAHPKGRRHFRGSLDPNWAILGQPSLFCTGHFLNFSHGNFGLKLFLLNLFLF